MPAPDAVLFDLDSTLCVSERTDHEIHAEVFDRVGVEPVFSPADVRAVDSEGLPTAHSDRGFYEQLYRAAAADVGRDPDDALLDELAAATVEVVGETSVTFREGAERALEHARERYPVGLVTNGGEGNQMTKLDQLGIREAFDATVFCDPANGVQPKPHPAPFRRALGALDAAPDRSVYVGDSLGADVAGANDLGMTSVWVPFERPHEDLPADPTPAPDHRLDSPADLPAVL